MTNATNRRPGASEEPGVRREPEAYTELVPPRRPESFRRAFGRAWRETWTGLGDFTGTALPFLLFAIVVLVLLSLIPKG